MATLEGSPKMQALRDTVLIYLDHNVVGALSAPKILEKVLTQININFNKVGEQLFAVTYENQLRIKQLKE